MPQYKKKKFSRIKRPKSKLNKSRFTKRTKSDNNAEFNSNETKSRNNKFKIINGNRIDKKIRLKVTIGFISAVLLLLILVNVCLPIGIVESLANAIAKTGTGKYPIDLVGTETLNVVSKSNYYYVLTNNRTEAFSKSGKRIFSIPHGFENPVLKTSETRALVFDIGGTGFEIFNLSSVKTNKNLKHNIITATICRNGTYAVATESDEYASVVTVYNKNNKLLYEWHSANDIVNNVALSSNGKKLAVSTINSKNGNIVSNLYVLNYKTATPQFSETFVGSAIYSLDAPFSSGFWITTPNKLMFVKWRNYKSLTYQNDYNAVLIRNSNRGTAFVFNRSNDKTDNKVVYFNKFGKLKYEVSIHKTVSDLKTNGNHLYSIGDNTVYLFDKNGKITRKGKCEYGGNNIVVLDINNVAVISDSKVQKVKLEG